MNKYLLLLLLLNISCNKKVESGTKGTISSKLKTKKVKYYNKNGELKKILEYVSLCGKEYLNQGWYFNNKLDTLFEKGNYYNMKIDKNVLKPNDTSKIRIKYKPLMKNSISVLVLSNQSINNNFCDLDKIKMDTLYFVDNELEFSLNFKNKGDINLAGYIFEIKELPKKVNKHSVFRERKVYLNIPIKVE